MRKVTIDALENHDELYDPTAEPEELSEITIKTATVYYIGYKAFKEKVLATVYFLCRDQEDKLFIMCRNILLDTDEDLESIRCLPISANEEEDYISQKIAYKYINSFLDSYMVDMCFYVEYAFERLEDPNVYMYGINIRSNEKIKFNMSADIFACINFIENYIFDDIDNEHDFSLAIAAASKVSEEKAQFFLVDSMDAVISMAPAVIPEKKSWFQKLKEKIFKSKELDEFTTLGIVMKVTRFKNRDEKETAYILTTFNTDTIYTDFEDPKFRGNTIESIQEHYYGDADQYVATLTSMNTRLYGNDKEYMIIRGKTKDKVLKLFLIDTAMQAQLKHLIDTY